MAEPFLPAVDSAARRLGTPTDDQLEERFRQWWNDEGSGMPPLPGMDHEEHVRRISQIAWHNGARVARHG